MTLVDTPHLGVWADKEKPSAMEFLEAALPPERWDEFLESYGSTRVWIPSVYDYHARDEEVRRLYDGYTGQGITSAEAIRTLARMIHREESTVRRITARCRAKRGA